MGIDTKRCQRCQKVLRADSRRCSGCGYVFLPVAPAKHNGSISNGSRRTVTLTMPANPPASPHRAGHYSGLHPEDQPFQSSFMPVQRAPAITRNLVDQEAGEAVLPTIMVAPSPPPTAPDTEDLPKRRVAVPTPLPLPMPQRGVDSPLRSPAVTPRRQFVSPPVVPASLTNQRFTEPVPAVLPLPRKQQKQSRVVPVLLSASCLLFLLATSGLAFLLLDRRPVVTTQHALRAGTHVSHAAPSMAVTPSALSFNAIRGTNPASQTFTISNKGNAPLNWAAIEDANGSAFAPVSPKQGTVAPGKTAVITVTPDVTHAPAGFINALITISDTGEGTPVPSQQVAITILNQAVINVSGTTMTFNLNGTNSNSTQSLVITNTGSAPLNWTVGQSLPLWLSINVTGGTLSPGGSKTVKVTCDSTDLSADHYTATLVVSDTDAGTPVVPQSVQVILLVS